MTRNTHKEAKINEYVLFGLIPASLLVGSSFISYIILTVFLIINKKSVCLSVVGMAVLLSYLLVQSSTVYGLLSNEQLLQTYNSTFGWMLILLSPWVRFRYLVSITSVSFYLMFMTFGVSLILVYTGIANWGVVQISAFSYCILVLMLESKNAKYITGIVILVSGARSIISGFVVAYFIERLKFIRAKFSLPVVIAIVLFLISGVGVALLYDTLLEFSDNNVLLKGRTRFWLAMIDTNPGFVENSAGMALVAVEDAARRFHLPHGDWLRIYSDFGMLAIVATLFIFYSNSKRCKTGRFFTIILAFFMLTGNAISFPTVVCTYIVFLNVKIDRSD